jgi:alkaline phosphatase D
MHEPKSAPPFFSNTPIPRRACLLQSAALLAGLGAPGILASPNQPAFSSDPFSLGIASGDPTADGFVLWTRLAPEPLAPGGGMPPSPVPVRWRVAEDEHMNKIVARGDAMAVPALAHSVHVEVAGLKPDRWYYYDFTAGTARSPLGRARTLERPGIAANRTSPLQICFASCQHYEAGFYTAYEHMLAEQPDLVFHLGDYIYEGAGTNHGVRAHLGGEIKTLDEYRIRHAQYKTDPALRAMHAAAPWVVTWDDHEFDNNYAADIPEEKGPAPRLEFLKRRAAAYQAYYEHMPLRAASRPNGPDMRLYRSIRHGGLVDFHVLDTRQYRSDQPHGDGRKPPGPELLDPRATLLGDAQRNWLMREFDTCRSRWLVLAQQVMMARVDRKAGPAEEFSMDQWPGYEIERRKLLTAMARLKDSHPVVLTGDIHTHWANDLILEDETDGTPRIVGSEWVGTSISSKGDGTDAPQALARLQKDNPFVRYFCDHRGYVRCNIGLNEWRSDFRIVRTVSKPGAPLETAASFTLAHAERGMKPVA